MNSDSELPPYPQPGEVLDDKYEIQKLLGQGAMGAVLRATHTLRKAPVALKFMSPEVMKIPGVVERFLNEGVAASRIDSDHVVKVLDVSKLPSGVPYLVMEYLEGEDLRELLEREGSPHLHDIPRCVHIVLQILRGLQVAHRSDIVHRDMKPSNCFVTEKDGERDFIKIVDFGISKVTQGEDAVHLTDAGTSLGTPLYMSPEQARNPRDVDYRSDLYACAVILYELLCGEAPFVPESGTLSELLIRLGTEDPKPLTAYRSDLPPGFWEVVEHGLAKKPADRFQTAADMAEALAPFADERSTFVLNRLTRKRTTGKSFFPPAGGPPTHVDRHRSSPSIAPPRSIGPNQTQAIDPSIPPPAPLPASLAGAAAARTAPSAPVTEPGSPPAATAGAVADTALSSARDGAPKSRKSQGRSLFVVGSTLGFAAAATVAYVALSGAVQRTDPAAGADAPSNTESATDSETATETESGTETGTQTAADTTTTDPDASASAAPSAPVPPDPTPPTAVPKPPPTASPPPPTGGTSLTDIEIQQ